MATVGIEIEVAEGFARIQFVDRAKRGDGLAALLAVGGPDVIDVDTRSGSRKVYIVPESIAIEAGLIDPVVEAVAVPSLPDGEPSDAWTIAQLREYAASKSIDLGDATKKADILALVLA